MEANGGAGALLRMGVGKVGLVMAFVVGAGCSGPDRGDCASTDCPDDQYCEVTSRICLSAGGPVVRILTPAAGVLTGQSVVLSGTVLVAAQATQVAYTVNATDASAARTSLLVSEQGSFSTSVPLPSGNVLAVPIQVYATSDAQQYMGEVTVQVNNAP